MRRYDIRVKSHHALIMKDFAKDEKNRLGTRGEQVNSCSYIMQVNDEKDDWMGKIMEGMTRQSHDDN